MQIRQAGALWGLSLCFHARPTHTMYQHAVETGLRFYTERVWNRVPHPKVKWFISLFGLAMIEYLTVIRRGDAGNSTLEYNHDFVDGQMHGQKP